MNKKLSKQQKGFTIIEVLIVLAIAGLIMLIVFLAVPALQRNSRNTQRRDDVGKLLSIVTEYSTNNNGQLPTNAVCFGEMAISGGNNTQPVSAPGGYYCKAAGTSISWDQNAAANNTTTDTVVLRSGARCDGTTGNATTQGASARSVVALYTLEIGTKQCQAT